MRLYGVVIHSCKGVGAPQEPQELLPKRHIQHILEDHPDRAQDDAAKGNTDRYDQPGQLEAHPRQVRPRISYPGSQIFYLASQLLYLSFRLFHPVVH